VAVNHPFTAPMDEDLERLESDPYGVRAKAYDVVWNGLELGGGSIRNHRPDIQERVFTQLGMSAAEARTRFGFLLDALSYGAPPHGGIALGFDRVCAMLVGADSIRDVIAFPKTTSATDLMCDAPGAVDARQLKDLRLRLASDPDPGLS
jgi:aspartyl-tRNA synthetase